MNDPSILWKGLLMWGIVSLGTLAIGIRLRPKTKLTVADALLAGLAAALVFWTLELIIVWCRTRRVEGFASGLVTKLSDPLSDPSLSPTAAPVTPVQFGRTPGSAPESRPLDDFGRAPSGLYSGDIVHITSMDPLSAEQKAYFQRDTFQSEILMGPFNTRNLTKLRFVLPDHDAAQLKPLHYHQEVYLMHNAYAENRNACDLYIKRSKTLVSHQTGTHYRSFLLVNPLNPEDRGLVQTQQPVWLLAMAGQGLPDAYLRVREDRRIDDGAGEDTSAATLFAVEVRRPAEPGDRHLVIAPNESLFP